MAVLRDAGRLCCTDTTLDLAKAQRRIEAEGESFLTITLPTFCKSFEQALAGGRVESCHFAGFKRRGGGLPRFLGGFLSQIFDPRSGVVLDVPSIPAIQAVRQVCLLSGKIHRPCSDVRQRQASRRYVECEKELRGVRYSPDALRDVGTIVSLIFGPALSSADNSVEGGTLVPRHGPGQTADRITGNGKYDQMEWTARLDAVFPMVDFLLANPREWSSIQSVQLLEPEHERPVKVVHVPKTMATTRVIAMEPVCMQYAQQALLREFTEVLSARTNEFADITCQSFNQEMACQGSRDGSLATLDLSEASDRVTLQLVLAAFRDFPNLREALEASRSSRADVPDHGILDLVKFASMGSATTFPVETIVFTAIAILGIHRSLTTSRSLAATIRWCKGKVRVYGDDIIVPSAHVHSVMNELVSFGMRVNSHKSFWTGKFRESCGREYYDGHDVCVARVRRDLPHHRRDTQELVSAISLRNQLYMLGYWGAAKHLDDVVRRFVPLPVVQQGSSVHGRWSVCFRPAADAWDPELQVPVVRGLIPRARAPRSPVSGQGALLKCLLPGRREPFQDPKHLEFAGRPQHVDTKLGMAQPW